MIRKNGGVGLSWISRINGHNLFKVRGLILGCLDLWEVEEELHHQDLPVFFSGQDHRN